MQWQQYIGKRGTINLGVRLEVMIANLMVLTANAHNLKKKGGVPFETTDFAIHLDKKELPDVTVDSTIAAFKSIGLGVKNGK